MKIRVFLISIILLITNFFSVPVKADSQPVVAIIDTGFNTALPFFKDKVVAEYCFVEYSTCPNGKTSMDGVGAASINFKTTNLTTNHGTQLASVISKVNPSVKFVLIRIVGYFPNGNPYLYTNGAVKASLDWILENQTKYAISVVNIAQGKIFANCGVPTGTAEVVAKLKSLNVAIIGATGNNSNKTAINSIACLPDVISIGATDNPGQAFTGQAYDPNVTPTIARYSNGSAPTFYANGRWYVTNVDGTTKFIVGTSTATASVVGWWTLNYKGSIPETIKFLQSNSKIATDGTLSGPYIFIPQS